MRTRFLATATTAVLTALLAVAAPAGAQSGGDVTVRVEGTATTLVNPTTASLTPGTFTKQSQCPNLSPGGALEKATAGDWGGQGTDFGQTLETIKGERHGFQDAESWEIYLNEKYLNSGVCSDVPVLQQGDDLLFIPQCNPFVDNTCKRKTPLVLRALPAMATIGHTIDVKVEEIVTEFDDNFTGTSATRPAAGATVTAGGSAAVTGADGIAKLKLNDYGRLLVKATRTGSVRSNGRVIEVGPGPADESILAACATNGADGVCGTPDRTPAVAAIRGITSGTTFTAGQAPRTLEGTARDANGINSVRLRLRRLRGNRCEYYSGRREVFVKYRCSNPRSASFFKIGDRAEWSYLLPEALTKGFYVLEVKALDKGGNFSVPNRGGSVVEWRVR